MEKTIKHTPGPWMFAYNDKEIHISIHTNEDAEKVDNTVCGIWGVIGDEQFANARLISAAPDLLKALHEIASRSRVGIIKKIAKSAIEKAKGTV
jgi:hypothetical protein